MKRSFSVPLIFIGTLGGLTGCSDDDNIPANSIVHLKQDSYNNLEDCKRDWGNDPKNCQQNSSTSSGGSGFIHSNPGNAFNNTSNKYSGPRYFWYRNEYGGYPMAVEPNGTTRSIIGSNINSSGARFASQSLTTRASLPTHKTASRSVLRSGFGHFGRGLSGGGANMQRLNITPRHDKAQKLEAMGLSFHAWDDYWNESVCYRFNSQQIDEIEVATETLHAMCMQAVAHAIEKERLGQLGFPKQAHDIIQTSWEKQELSLYGRFDLAYDGISAPRMLEYNADTPTSLLESAVAQWYWLEEVFPQADQFNAIHEKLLARWQQLNIHDTLYVASLDGNEEDWVCAHYLIETAIQAGVQTEYITLENIGWDTVQQNFVDLAQKPIGTLFKLYPWEWIFQEPFGKHIGASQTRFIEPAWKAVLSCKGILPILWELFEDHPNLLPAYFTAGRLQHYARKPLFSREGSNVLLHTPQGLISQTSGPYGVEGFIDQALAPMTAFQGRYPVIGSWIVGDHAAGMCLREDNSPITTNMSQFIPHFFD